MAVSMHVAANQLDQTRNQTCRNAFFYERCSKGHHDDSMNVLRKLSLKPDHKERPATTSVESGSGHVSLAESVYCHQAYR
jgi:hypothetical protein